MVRARTWLLVVASLCVSAASASSQPASKDDPPPAPRIFHAPTAWLQPAGQAFGSVGANHRASGLLAVSLGLGGIAEVDLNLSDRFQHCTAACADKREIEPAWVGSALFKIGLGEDVLAHGQPAVALGFRRSLVVRKVEGMDEPRLAELYLVVGKRFSTASIHLGAQLFDVKSGGERLLAGGDVLDKLRPMIGLSWRPPQYPTTTVLADVSYVPELQFDGERSATALQWIGGWGIRYQALVWGSVELGVRHRGGDSLEDSTVFVRFNAVTSFRRAMSR